MSSHGVRAAAGKVCLEIYNDDTGLQGFTGCASAPFAVHLSSVADDVDVAWR
jgi:hypothetical protein